jgi:diguanylate cyclase (GGDEF)-like protein/PAS domain S-box-containing protein
MLSLFSDEKTGAELIARLHENLPSGDSVAGQCELARKGGDPVALKFRAALLDGAGPERRRMIIFTGDSRQERPGERALQSLARLSDENPSPVLRISGDGLLLYANRGSWLLQSHWNTEVGKQIPPVWFELVRGAIRSGQSREEELRIGFKTYLLIIVPVPGMGYVNIFGLDVTARKQVERKLHQDAQVFESASEAIMIMDTDMRILDVNLAYETITGYTREEVLGEEASILKSGKRGDGDITAMWESIRSKGSWQGEIWDRRKNGEAYPKWLSLSSIVDDTGAVARYIGLFSDISTMKQTQERLYYLAHYDSLTGLANRRHFLDRLEQSIEDAKRTKEQMAVLFIDLDSFKQVNDTYGHRAGDQFLREAANRIRASLRQSDIVARMGGDEFTAILPHVKNVEDSAVAAQKLLNRMVEPLTLDQQEIFMSSSVGIAIYPKDATDMESLLQFADTALYKAKELGRNCYQFYSPEMNQRAAEILSLKAKLRKGIDLDEFILYYQPQIAVHSGRVVGVEALARWKSRELGLIGPDRFIPLAEETGMIHEIGGRMLRYACGQGQAWRKEGLEFLKIAVNVSSVQLKRSDFASIAESAIAEYGMPPNGLEIEITESVLLIEDETVMSQLKRLKDLGVTLAIDDFGTKYSSLSYLRRLPIDRLKIDMSFVRDLPEDKGSLAIAAAIIAMGHSMNLEVVAEGVETRGQAEVLAEKGCDIFQGLFFSGPMPPDRLRAFVTNGWIPNRPSMVGATTGG